MLKRNLLLIAKIAPALAVAYTLCPVDAIPDFLPVVGQLDDLLVLLLLISLSFLAAVALLVIVKQEEVRLALFLMGFLVLTWYQRAYGATESPADALSPSVQPPVPLFKLSLADAFRRAGERNRQLAVLQENRAIARANVTIARAYPNPNFGLQYGFGSPYTKIICGDTQQVGLSQTFEYPGKTVSRIRAAKAAQNLAQAQYEAAQFDLRIQVRRAYAELAAAEANIELVSKQHNLTDKLRAIAQKKFQAGSSPGVDVMQAELAVMQLETQRVQAQTRLRQASAQMDLLIGEDPSHVIDVEDNGIFRLSAERTTIVPEIADTVWPLKRLLDMAYSSRPDIKVALEQIETNRRGIQSQRAQQIPDLMLGSGYVFSTFLKDQNVPVQRGIYFNVNMDMPILYRHQGEVQLAQATYRQSIKQLDAVKAQIQTEVETAYQAFVAARQNIIQYQTTILPKASDVSRLARRSYETGFQPISAVILAQQQYEQIRLSYFDTVVAYQNAWADLEKAVGQPLGTP